MRVLNLVYAAVLSLSISPASGQTSVTVPPPPTFGAKLSIASIAAQLQSSGYQALIGQAPPNLQNVLGVITTGIGGANVIILANKCINSTADEICSLTVGASYNDDKNLLSDNLLAALNSKTSFARVIRGTNNKTGMTTFNIMYGFVCNNLDDPKIINPVLANFGADISRVLIAYNAAAPQPAAQAPAPAAAK